MNARSPLPTFQTVGATQGPDEADGIDLVEYWDILVDNRWLIMATAAVALAIGATYAALARPSYESNLLIQVEAAGGSSRSFFGDAASLVDVKTGVAAEIEIIRSRMILGQAVDNTLLNVEAKPRYAPVIGRWLASRAGGLSEPGFLGFSGFVTGREAIRVAAFDVPSSLEGAKFRLTAGQNGAYVLSDAALQLKVPGRVGVPLTHTAPAGTIGLLVSAMDAKPGSDFELTRRPRLAAIGELQSGLRLVEKGRQSGMIEATLLSGNPEQLPIVLNEIARLYIRQNVERKAAEAQKMLAFLDVQLPQFKQQLEASEESFNKYRAQKGTISFTEEARALLSRSVEVQGKLFEAQQKRLELLSRFTSEHPAVKTFDAQVLALSGEAAALTAKTRALPAVEQDALRLERDFKVNSDAYQSLRNNALQLQLIREGKVGNVRLIDEATPAGAPVRPNADRIMLLSLLIGVLSGIGGAFARNAFFRGIRNPHEIETQTGLNVYSTIPLSPRQLPLAQAAQERRPGMHLLALQAPTDAAVESLRSLRTALQFSTIEAPNNRVLLTGPTPGVGKSFVSCNFAAVLAGAGKRVLLVDADLRKGHLHLFFGISREQGLSELICGLLKQDEVIHRDVQPNLDVITTGKLPPNPAELMMSAGFAGAMEQLSDSYDVVLIDTPPVLVASDTLGAAPVAGTVLLVARAGVSHVGELNESAKRLAQVGKAVNGVLLNAIDITRRHYGSYGYRYVGYRYRHYSYSTGE